MRQKLVGSAKVSLLRLQRPACFGNAAKAVQRLFAEHQSIFASGGAAECPGQLLPSTFSSDVLEDFLWVLEKGEMAYGLEAPFHLSHKSGLMPTYTHAPPIETPPLFK